ncbi:MAG TPA: cupin domain-containing protein, partial [Cyclobacteriaceae bacterium]
MKIMSAIIFSLIATWGLAQSPDRVVHNDPARYRELSAVHAGAGKMGFTQLIGRDELAANFLYLHAGSIAPKSGIGHHFHHSIEEMYVILNGEAEFTVNGRTSKIKAPAIVPCKMGDSHAIYNPSSESIRWLNFAVSRVKGKGDAFDLGDARVGAKLDPTPVFVSGRLEHEKLKPNTPAYPAEGVLYRRILGPDVFSTDWSYVDHLVISANSSTDAHSLKGVEEVYYVIKGSGSLTINGSKTTVKADDAFYGKLGETLILSNEGKDDLEVLVIGVAAKSRTAPEAMVLQMDFVVAKENAEAFEKMYHSIYVPAMVVQEGYLGSKCLRLFPEDLSREIEGELTTYNYQIQIYFDSEESRRK